MSVVTPCLGGLDHRPSVGEYSTRWTSIDGDYTFPHAGSVGSEQEDSTRQIMPEDAIVFGICYRSQNAEATDGINVLTLVVDGVDTVLKLSIPHDSNDTVTVASASGLYAFVPQGSYCNLKLEPGGLPEGQTRYRMLGTIIVLVQSTNALMLRSWGTSTFGNQFAGTPFGDLNNWSWDITGTGGRDFISDNGVITNHGCPCPIGGTFSNLFIRIHDQFVGAGAMHITLVVNGVKSELTTLVGLGGGPKVQYNIIDQVTVLAGDLLYFQILVTGGDGGAFNDQWLTSACSFTPTNGADLGKVPCFMTAENPDNNRFSYVKIADFSWTSSSGLRGGRGVPACTVSDMHFWSEVEPGASTFIVNLRKADADSGSFSDSTLTASITGTNQLGSDIVNTDDIESLGKLNWKLTRGGSGGLQEHLNVSFCMRYTDSIKTFSGGRNGFFWKHTPAGGNALELC